MCRVFKEREGKLYFRQSAVSLTLGWLLLIVGLGFSGALIAGSSRVARRIRADPASAVFLLFPAGCVGGGIGLLRASRWQVVDPRRKELHRHRFVLSLREAQAVLLSSSTRVARTGTQQAEYQTWELGVVTDRIAPRTRDVLHAVTNLLDRRSRDATTRSEVPWRTLQRRLSECRTDFWANRVTLISNAYEGQVWRAAKRLGEELDLPLVDDAGESPLLLTPRLVRLPLVERLRRIGAESAAPEAMPAGARCENSGGRLRIEYRHQRWLPIGVVFVVSAVLAAGSIPIAQNAPAWGVLFPLVPAASVLCFLPFAGRGHGRNTLEVDGHAIRYTSRFLIPHAQTIELATLERIRANRLLHPSLSLIGDRKILRCPMPADLVGPVRESVLRFLLTASGGRLYG